MFTNLWSQWGLAGPTSLPAFQLVSAKAAWKVGSGIGGTLFTQESGAHLLCWLENVYSVTAWLGLPHSMAARFQEWGSRERAKQTPFRTQPQKSRSIVFSAFYLSRQSQRPTQVYREKTETPPLDGALGGFWKWMCDWKYCHGHFWKMQTASNHMKGLISWSDILEKEVLFGSHKTWFWKLPVPITNCVMEPQCAHL